MSWFSMELKEIGCPILARCSRGWDTMSAISPGVLSRSRFFHSPILFRESNPAALIASLFAKGKTKKGRLGHPPTFSRRVFAEIPIVLGRLASGRNLLFAGAFGRAEL